jgi:hypothetical protein
MSYQGTPNRVSTFSFLHGCLAEARGKTPDTGGTAAGRAAMMIHC